MRHWTTNLSTKLAFLAIPSFMLLTSCGGGKVVVAAPAATPVPTAFAPAPVPSSVVVTTVPVTPAPPSVAAVTEPSPGPDYVRVEGYYNWVGDRYVWVPSTWVRAPHTGATFVPGHWQTTTGGYIWIAGHWE